MRQMVQKPLIVFGLVLSITAIVDSSRAAGVDGVHSAVVEGNNAFAFDLYRQYISPDTANFVYSPYSISSAFGMLYAGARGTTADEIGRVMHWSVDEPIVHSTLGALSDDLNARNGERFDFAVANRLWGASRFPFKQPFLDTLQSDYRAPLETLDFYADPESGRQRINAWVQQQTRDKIVDLLPAGSIKQNTGLVLTNAVYMKAKWQSPFKKESTYTGEFHTSEDESHNVSMMYQRSSLSYGAFDGFQMVELPYRASDVSMVVVLPSEIDGLAALEENLTANILQDSLDAMTRTSVSLRLPKFRIESQLNLNASLAALGMVETFANPDLTRIADVDLFVDRAIHKAVIEVDEAGTEAAAATAIVVGITTCMCPPPAEFEVFNADHPFLYFLRDQRTDSILFMGRLGLPESVDGTTTNPPGELPIREIKLLPGDGIPFPELTSNPGGVQVPEPSSALLAGITGVSLLIFSRRLHPLRRVT